MFSRSFMNFDDDPFFNAQQEHMRDMNRMMGGFGGFGRPFGGSPFGGSPFGGSPFGMLEGPQDHRGEGQRSMVPRHDGFMGGFGSMFGNMNSMMSQMHRNFDNVNMGGNPNNGYSFSSSKVMTYSNDGRGEPKYFEASSSTKTAPGGVKETQRTLRDSESGLHKMAMGHHIGDRAHVIEKSRSTRTEDEEQKQDFVNIDESDAGQFDREWKEKSKGFYGGRNRISGFDGDHRRHGGENRSRAMPALEHHRVHREREGRDKHNTSHEKKLMGDDHKRKKEKKVRIAENESHL